MEVKRRYDYLVVGAGLFGASFAYEAVRAGKSVLVVDRRDHIGGNCWSYDVRGVEVHAYGPHIVHTNDPSIWSWFGRFAQMVPCVPAPITLWQGHMYSLPFSMHTFNQLWGVVTPDEAKAVIKTQRIPCMNPRNLEEHVLAMVGIDIYERLVKGYTEKQYGKPCSELPASLISRMPVLFEWSTNYNGKIYQGVPSDGYGQLFDTMLHGVDVRLGVDFLDEREVLSRLAREVVFTGPVDEYYRYQFGPLEWRGRRFKNDVREADSGQGAAVINYQDERQPTLRSIEHALLLPEVARKSISSTVVTDEYAIPWEPGDEPFYTVNDVENQNRYKHYEALAQAEDDVYFGGRLGEYRYYTMEDTVKSVWRLCDRLFGRKNQ